MFADISALVEVISARKHNSSRDISKFKAVYCHYPECYLIAYDDEIS